MPGAWAQGGLSPSPSPSPPQLSGHSRGCPGRARLQLSGTPWQRAVWSSPPPPPGSQRAGDSPEPAQGPRSPPGQPQPSPQPGRSWSRACDCRAQHGCLAAPGPRPTAPGMPWEGAGLPGSPGPQAYSSRHALGRSFLLSDPAGTPSPRPAQPPRRPHGRLAGAALSPALEPRGSREEEEERGTERQRGVGQGGEVAGEGRETGRGTRRTGGKWAGSGGRRSGGEEPAQG